MVKLEIIIVNWNSGCQLNQCLESIVNTRRDSFQLKRVVVVDNGSSDNSAQWPATLDLPLTCIRNPCNRGFGAACNQGAEGSRADYLLFLNPDTRLDEDSLEAPLVFMERQTNQHIGIAGVQLVNASGQVSRTCARFPVPGNFVVKSFGLNHLLPDLFRDFLMKEWDHGCSREVDHVMGAFFMVRRSLFEALNGFDERFFMYLEDLDFSLRARKTGWSSTYLADAQICHAGGGQSRQARAARLSYDVHSRILYGYKHFGLWVGTGLMLGVLLIEPFTRLMLALIKRSTSRAEETIQGYGLFWKTLLQQRGITWRP